MSNDAAMDALWKLGPENAAATGIVDLESAPLAFDAFARRHVERGVEVSDGVDPQWRAARGY